jgi:large subunit ribosomal protein L14
MIQLGSRLKVVDNSGAKEVECIHVLGSTRRRYAYLGDIIIAAVKKAMPRKDVKKHDVVKALIVRQKKEFRRKDGSYIRFSENSCVILDTNGQTPKGGRIIGPIAREIKEKGFTEVAALAKEIV